MIHTCILIHHGRIQEKSLSLEPFKYLKDSSRLINGITRVTVYKEEQTQSYHKIPSFNLLHVSKLLKCPFSQIVSHIHVLLQCTGCTGKRYCGRTQ